MSSLPPSTIYRIVLFQSGLGDDGSSIDGLINQLVSASSLFVKYNGSIDMSHYNPSTDDFCSDNGSHSNTYEQQFINDINSVISNVHTNYTKTILVKTDLNKVFGVGTNYNRCLYDSIENQSKKLVKIIDSIKIHSCVNLTLIGHSQGGLVNLKAAIARPLKIYKMISISTPYAPVTVGSDLLLFENIVNLFNKSLTVAFNSIPEYANYLVQSVNTLTSATFFNELKSQWNAIGYNPPLTVITGVSGLLKSISYFAPLGYSLISFRPFDGLVCIKEQRDISHASFVDLINHNAYCYENRNFIPSGSSESCYSIVGMSHVGCSNGPNCSLPSINLQLTGFQELINIAHDYSCGVDVESNEYITSHPIVLAIDEGLSQTPYTGLANYQMFYDIASDQYNHLNILKNAETVGTIIGVLYS